MVEYGHKIALQHAAVVQRQHVAGGGQPVVQQRLDARQESHRVAHVGRRPLIEEATLVSDQFGWGSRHVLGQQVAKRLVGEHNAPVLVFEHYALLKISDDRG